METDEMKKILMAAAASIVFGAPLAFAAGTTAGSPPLQQVAAETAHCPALEQQVQNEESQLSPAAAVKDAGKMDESLSLCRQDKHKNDVEKVGAALRPGTGAKTPVLLRLPTGS
jgi:hypothetical protein